MVSAPLACRRCCPVLHRPAGPAAVSSSPPRTARRVAPDGPREIGLAEFLGRRRSVPPSRCRRRRTRWRSGCIRRVRPGQPKGVRHVHRSLRATADTYGAQVLRIRADDLMFSAAKAFHAYGLGNCMTFPMSVGAAAVLLPDRPTPDAVLATMQRHQPTIFGGVPTLYAALLAQSRASARAPGRRGCAAASPPARRCRRTIGPRWYEMVGRGHPRRHRLHRDAAHLRLQPRPTTCATARPASRCRATRRVIAGSSTAADVPNGEAGELVVRGPSAAEGYWNQRDKTPPHVPRRVDAYRRHLYPRRRTAIYRFCGRTDEMLKVSGVWVSPFEVEEALIAHPAVLESAVVGAQDARRADQAQGVRRAAGCRRRSRTPRRCANC